MAETVPLSDGTIAQLSAEPRRRALLNLLATSGNWTVSKLSQGLAAHESATKATRAEVRRRIEIALVHNHLPRLADHGLIEYDHRSGDVVTTEKLERFAPAIRTRQRARGVLPSD